MAIEVIDFLGTRGIFLLVLGIFLLVLIIVLFVVQRGIKKSLIIKESVKLQEDFLLEEFQKIKRDKSSNSKKAEILDDFAKRFLRQSFNLQSGDYPDWEKRFREEKPAIANFCREMVRFLYAGERGDSSKIQRLILQLEKIIEDEYPKLKQPLSKPIEREIPKQEIVEPVQEIKKEELAKPLIEKKEDTGSMDKLPTLKLTPLQELDNIERIKRKIEQHPDVFVSTRPVLSLDYWELRRAYKLLQTRFMQIYEKVKKENNQLALKRLDAFRLFIIKRVDDYQTLDKRKEFAEAIQDGMTMLDGLDKK